MKTMSLTQLQRLSGLPAKWLSAQLKKGIPSGATLSESGWHIPYLDERNLIQTFRNLYNREVY